MTRERFKKIICSRAVIGLSVISVKRKKNRSYVEMLVLILQRSIIHSRRIKRKRGTIRFQLSRLKIAILALRFMCGNMKTLQRCGRRRKGQQKSDRCRVNTMGVWRSPPGPTAAKRRTARSLGARGLLKMMLKERIMEMSCYSSSGLPYYRRLSPFALKLQVASSLLPPLLHSFSYLLVHS